MIGTLAVVVPPPRDLVLGGLPLADRAVARARHAVPGCWTVISPLNVGLARLVDEANAQEVLLLDATYPFVTDDLLVAVRHAISPEMGDAAAVAVAEVSDTLKPVDGVLVAASAERTVERSDVHFCAGVMATTPAVLGSVLSFLGPAAGIDLVDLVERVERVVGVRRVLAPGAVSRVVDDDSLAYAEALLAARRASATATSSG